MYVICDTQYRYDMQPSFAGWHENDNRINDCKNYEPRHVVLFDHVQNSVTQGGRRDCLLRHSDRPTQCLCSNCSLRHGCIGISHRFQTHGQMSCQGIRQNGGTQSDDVCYNENEHASVRKQVLIVHIHARYELSTSELNSSRSRWSCCVSGRNCSQVQRIKRNRRFSRG